MGQGRFRKLLLDLWDGRCAVTGIELPSVLLGSHVKPWRSSANAERLDPYNGLLLLPQYDKLFDRGYVTFDDRRWTGSGAVRLGLRRDRGAR